MTVWQVLKFLKYNNFQWTKLRTTGTCNAAYYEKQSGKCQLAQLTSLVDTSIDSSSQAKVHGVRTWSYIFETSRNDRKTK